MEADRSRVAIKLQISIHDHGQMEETTTKTTGYLYNQNTKDVLTYEEQATDTDGMIKNMLTIQPDKVSIKRSGAVNMHQQFHLEQTSESVFQHAYGAIHMETYAKAIDYRPFDAATPGKLTIAYLVRLNGQDPREHQLTLTISNTH
ncbi:DUF1934 domain-containing protein [Lentibacillus sp. N15]|uniref:DUF1934 domain-containing protein n=1 Tax=Lentibacillus songyuanensis TaxID=3136161 RepID=UPI0031BA32BE